MIDSESEGEAGIEEKESDDMQMRSKEDKANSENEYGVEMQEEEGVRITEVARTGRLRSHRDLKVSHVEQLLR